MDSCSGHVRKYRTLTIAGVACLDCFKCVLTCSVNHYKCPLCDMTCPSPSALRQHVRYRHSEEKPFKCGHCEFRYCDSLSLPLSVSVCLSVYVPVSICLSLSMSLFLSVCLSVCLSLSLCLSVCVCVFLYLSVSVPHAVRLSRLFGVIFCG